MRIVTAAMLKGMGCDVEAVVHGEEAVNSANAESFDVIVLDIEMPVMDGITAARSIRRLGGPSSRTPIMALSAFLADAMRSASWSDTFDIALPKPTNKNELHAAVKAALQWRSDARGIGTESLPLVCSDTLAGLTVGISAAVWRELLQVACRDIEVCAAQLGHTARAGIRGSESIFAEKLEALGRTFAAPRLAAAAQAFISTADGPPCAQSCDNLVSVAHATASALSQT